MREQYRHLVERGSAGICQISGAAADNDDDAERALIVYANAAMARLVEAEDAQRLCGRLLAEFLGPDARPVMAEACRGWRRGGGASLEVQLQGRRGGRANALVCGAALGGERGDLVLTCIEIPAEQKRLNEHLLRAARMESIGRLAGGVAHDFNNLLAVISGYGESLLRRTEVEAGQVPHPLREHVEEIHRAASRGAALVQQLLAFSRRQTAAPRVMDLSEAVRGVHGMLRPVMGRVIEMRLSADQALPVKADPGQIEQIVVNLTINARDAMPGGGVLAIATAAADAPPGLSAPGRCARLSVSDTGAGMDADTTAHIFEPFFTTKGNAGSGLGLSIVYGIVQQAGGQIAVRSEVGRGTQFDVYFPLAQPAATGLHLGI